MKRYWLDLFCKAGGNARGMMKRGITPLGVDIEPQPNYPGPFLQMDALQAVRWLLRGEGLVFSRELRTPITVRIFDLEGIWASPPCHAGSSLRHAHNAKEHPQLIPPTRHLLKRVECEHNEWRPQEDRIGWIIENVESDETRRLMPNAIRLCGSHFNLGVWVGGPEDQAFFQLQRHRLFETSFPVREPACKHTKPVIGIYGGHARNRSSKHGGRGTADFVGQDRPALAAHALGLKPGSMTTEELSNAIPPAYAAYLIGEYERSLRLSRFLS